MHQTKEERKLKYEILTKSGANQQLRRRARDWTWNHVKKLILANHFEVKNHESALHSDKPV